jgi:hypothetical protein
MIASIPALTRDQAATARWGDHVERIVKGEARGKVVTFKR